MDEKFAYTNSEMRTDQIEKRMAHFGSTFITIKRFNEIRKCCSQTMRAFLSKYPRAICDSFSRVETESRFLRTLYASLPCFCVQLDLYAEICVNATHGTLSCLSRTVHISTSPTTNYPLSQPLQSREHRFSEKAPSTGKFLRQFLFVNTTNAGLRPRAHGFPAR